MKDITAAEAALLLAGGVIDKIVIQESCGVNAQFRKDRYFMVFLYSSNSSHCLKTVRGEFARFKTLDAAFVRCKSMVSGEPADKHTVIQIDFSRGV